MSDPYEWQVCHSLAEALSVCPRTIRGWVDKGKTEKTRADGKVLYRLVRKPAETLAVDLVTDAPTEDPYVWQPCESLADVLGVSERTVRLWEEKGKTEKTKMKGGRVFYRLKEQALGFRPAPEALPAAAAEPPGTVVSVVSMADYKQHISELYERIIKAEVEVAELRLLADVAVRDAEREAERADQLEEDADRLRESKEEMTRKYWSGVRKMR